MIEIADLDSAPREWSLSWNYASIRRRSVAWIVDSAIVIVLWMVEILIITMLELNTEGSRGELSFFLVLILYGVGFTALGATPGKRLFGLRVVDREQQRPGLARSFVRNLTPGFKWCWPILLLMLAPGFDYYMEVHRSLYLLGLLLFFVPPVLFLASAGVVQDSPYHRALHDKLAGTYVIRV